MSVLSRLLARGDDDRLVIEPLRRRHLADVLAIEQVSYPKPWSRGVFQSELELTRGSDRYYIVARAGATVVGYSGLMFVVGDAHVTNIAVTADRQRTGVATRMLADLRVGYPGRHASRTAPYRAALTSFPLGPCSCMRMISASSPPTKKKNREVKR